jgi:putative tricarboxylic transport membrane protein
MTHSFDRYASFIFLLLGIGFITESTKLASSAYGSKVGPSIFPLGLGIILVILSLLLLYETFKKKQKPNEKEKQSLDYRRFFIIAGSAVAYGLLLETLGYVISTFLFLVVAFQTLEKGGWGKTILISAALSGGIYYLFAVVLQGSLPGFPAWF